MRFFLEVAYIGDRYAGFQVQQNANTVQAEVEKAMLTIFKQPVALTGSSRTDAGVHARQNFFHFDAGFPIQPKVVYNLNALLPPDIAVSRLQLVADTVHCRFDAISRCYQYFIHNRKNPFLQKRAYFYPYQLNLQLLNEAASALPDYTDFTTFSKRNTQTATKLCIIRQSQWQLQPDGQLVYTVEANRFLRGMVRGLVGTMLRVGRGRLSVPEFWEAIEAKDCSKADFSVAAHGLYLMEVKFPEPVMSPVL